MMSYGPMVPLLDKRVMATLPPPRGDVIVFAFPEDPRDNFIKRTIGLPGDVIEAKHGHPIINGWEVPSCKVGTYVYEESGTFGDLYMEYLGDASYLTVYKRGQDSYDREGPFRVKPGEVFMMGDNRNDSNDSRRWYGGRGGGVPFDNIAGRAKFVWLSMGNDGSMARVGSSVQGVADLPAPRSAALLERASREHHAAHAAAEPVEPTRSVRTRLRA
jgi:signal peptidase I